MTTPMTRRLLIGLGYVWALAVCFHVFCFSRPVVPVVPLRDLIKTEGASTVGWDGKAVIVEGYWRRHVEGLSVSTSAANTIELGEFLLMRPDSSFTKKGFRLASVLPAKFQPAPVWLSTGDYVRMTGFYHAKGYSPVGTILEDCEWFEFREIERWDTAFRKWQKDAHP